VTDQEQKELASLKQGLLNDITLRRLTQELIKLFELPDGRYELVSSASEMKDGKYSLIMELSLPITSPVKYGTAVVGAAVHLFLDILADSPSSFMDLAVCNFKGPMEVEEETFYSISARLFDDRAGVEALSA